MSFLGVLLLLVCTPLGFIRLFGVVGQVLVKPHLMRDVNEEYHAFYLEEASVLRKLENLQYNRTITSTSSLSSSSTPTSTAFNAPPLSTSSMFNSTKYYDINTIPKAIGSFADSILRYRPQDIKESVQSHHSNHSHTTIFYNTVESDKLYERLQDLKTEREELDKLRSSTAVQRNLIYPIAMLMLLFLTGITVLIVVQNTLELLIGIKALPLSTRVSYLF